MAQPPRIPSAHQAALPACQHVAEPARATARQEWFPPRPLLPCCPTLLPGRSNGQPACCGSSQALAAVPLALSQGGLDQSASCMGRVWRARLFFAPAALIHEHIERQLHRGQRRMAPNKRGAAPRGPTRGACLQPLAACPAAWGSVVEAMWHESVNADVRDGAALHAPPAAAALCRRPRDNQPCMPAVQQPRPTTLQQQSPTTMLADR